MGDMITVEVGDPVLFDADGSYAWIFENCEACCEPVEAHMQYEWNFDDGTYSHIPRTTHVYDTPGTYYVSLMVDTVNLPYHGAGMFNWDYITVKVVPAGEPLNANADGEDLGEYETTIKEPVTLFGAATGGKAPYSYSWDFGDGTSTMASSQTAYTIKHTYEAEGTYTVTLTVVDATGSVAIDTSTVVVYGIEELVISIGGSNSVAAGDAAAFTSTVAGGRGPYSYAWNFGDGFISDAVNPTHIYENSGTYTVTLTVTDANGEKDTRTRTITVQPSGGTSEVEITDVSGGFLLTATINSDEAVAWSIDVNGMVFLGGHADGTALGSTQVKLPFSFGFGNVDVVITAGGTQETYSAFMLGPFLLNLA
jgi:PKD repeat protein